MFKYSIKTFIYASIAFLVVGVAFVFTQINSANPSGTLANAVGSAFPIIIFVILTSFALSVASLLIRFNEKYLKDTKGK